MRKSHVKHINPNVRNTAPIRRRTFKPTRAFHKSNSRSKPPSSNPSQILFEGTSCEIEGSWSGLPGFNGSDWIRRSSESIEAIVPRCMVNHQAALFTNAWERRASSGDVRGEELQQHSRKYSRLPPQKVNINVSPPAYVGSIAAVTG
jgi:hypothetical protein